MQIGNQRCAAFKSCGPKLISTASVDAALYIKQPVDTLNRLQTNFRNDRPERVNDFDTAGVGI
jgi:hypothetical protein